MGYRIVEERVGPMDPAFTWAPSARKLVMGCDAGCHDGAWLLTRDATPEQVADVLREIATAFARAHPEAT